MQSRSIVLITVALVLMLGVSDGLYAQFNTASIVGRAADQTGGVLPGVTVTIESPVLLVSQSATTVGTGRYRFAELPVGTYTVTFELSGFKTVVRSDVILTADFTATVNADMELATVAETVTVSGESPVVDVRSTVVKETFDRQRLEEIPTSRDPWVIIEQTPGIVMDRQNVGGNESGPAVRLVDARNKQQSERLVLRRHQHHRHGRFRSQPGVFRLQRLRGDQRLHRRPGRQRANLRHLYQLPGQTGHQRAPRRSVLVPRPQQHAERQHYPCA